MTHVPVIRTEDGGAQILIDGVGVVSLSPDEAMELHVALCDPGCECPCFQSGVEEEKF